MVSQFQHVLIFLALPWWGGGGFGDRNGRQGGRDAEGEREPGNGVQQMNYTRVLYIHTIIKALRNRKIKSRPLLTYRLNWAAAQPISYSQNFLALE
ncbi:hypothetical protein MSIMFI_04919 [Mycobacterium simulans]|nr:hypothetical protein MSIMFI_04919 [Mycobacterium simulans]